MTKALAGLIVVMAVACFVVWCLGKYATARVKARKWEQIEADRRRMTVIQDDLKASDDG